MAGHQCDSVHAEVLAGHGPVGPITRPTSTIQGVAALLRSQTNRPGGTPDGCLQFARADFVPTIISTGHIDGFDIDYVGGRLTLDIHDHTVVPVNDDLPPAETLLVALPGSLSTVPSGSSFACLGTAGSPVYLLPQQQDVNNLLWPGLDTGDVPSGQLQNNKVALQLVSSTVPAGARFALYTTSLGSASFRLNTNTAPGCQITTWPGGGIDSGTHAHAFWAFSAAGIYTLTFRATATTTGGAAVSSGDQTYTFLVG